MNNDVQRQAITHEHPAAGHSHYGTRSPASKRLGNSLSESCQKWSVGALSFSADAATVQRIDRDETAGIGSEVGISEQASESLRPKLPSPNS